MSAGSQSLVCVSPSHNHSTDYAPRISVIRSLRGIIIMPLLTVRLRAWALGYFFFFVDVFSLFKIEFHFRPNSTSIAWVVLAVDWEKLNKVYLTQVDQKLEPLHILKSINVATEAEKVRGIEVEQEKLLKSGSRWGRKIIKNAKEIRCKHFTGFLLFLLSRCHSFNFSTMQPC